MAIYKGNTIIAGAEDTAKNVKTDTAQTITGVKTIAGSGSTALQIKNTSSTADVVPTENNGRFLEFVDKNGVKEGYLEFYHHTARRYIAINVSKDAGATVAGQLLVGIDSQGNTFTAAPTPAASSNTNEIATTQWVKSVAGNAVVAYQHPTAANGYTWYRKWADGWVEQGGIRKATTSAGGGFDQTITLPIKMSDNNYCVSGMSYRENNFASYNGFYYGCVVYRTSTQIRVRTTGANTSQYIDGVTWEVKGMAA